MGRIEIRTVNEKRKEAGICPVLVPVFLLAGVYGILLFLQSLEGVDFSEWAVLPFAALLCTAVCAAYYRKRKLFYMLSAGIAAVCIVYIAVRQETLKVQAGHMIKNLIGETDLAVMQITELSFVLSAILTIGLFFIEFLINDHALLYLLTTAMLLLAPLAGVRTRLGSVFFLIVFQITFWTVQITGLWQSRWSFYMDNRLRILKKSSVVIGVMLMLLFCTAYLLTGFFEENLYESVYDAEGFLTRTAGRLSGKAANTVTGGRVSRGNLYQTGTPHLELEVDVKPTETLYLRGFGGGEYIGGDWIRSSDEALFENMSETLDWGRWSHFINRIYYSMYYIMNDSVQKNHSPDPRTLKIVHSSGKYETTYVPYYSQRSTYYYNSDYDRMDGYVYRYFEQNEMNVDWENIIEDFEPQRDWYRAIMEAYIFEAQTAYTVVPKERLPKLVKLVEEHPLEELDEITAFILYTLQSNASYTLTPGWVALNEDIVEYFLFEGRNGYCVHFASAATLMYRLYGIPARYATGYIVSPLDFERQKDGTYRAVVTDESAHAWAEIFLENYGWTPVEVTPAADGSMAASYPGFDRTKFDTLVTKHKWDLELPEFENAGKHQRQDLKGSENIFKNIEIEWEKYRDFILVTASCLVYSLVLLPLFLDYRRLRCLWKMERMGCRKVFTELLQMLHFAGILPECDGTEPDFYRKWAAAVPSITIEEAKRFIEIISRAAYGDKQPEGAEEAFVYVVYMHTADYVCHSLGRWKKLVFKYVKVFG